MALREDQFREDPVYRALASMLSDALAAIPVPTTVKYLPMQGDKEEPGVRERIFVRGVSFADLLGSVEPQQEKHYEDLLAALILLESLGIVIMEQTGLEPKIFPTSEAAGYLLHGLSKLIGTFPCRKSPIHPDSSINKFQPVMESALSRGQINPHLVLANILECGRQSAVQEPLRAARIISVLLKGERVEPESHDGGKKDGVYLHVWKPQWDSYALIGSVQNPGEDDLATARLALEEDIENPSDTFRLRPSGVEDDYYVDLSINRGAYTRYTFNLFIVEAMDGTLRLRDDLKYDWFTYEEICNQQSRMELSIMTRASLLGRLDETPGLDSIPTLVVDPKPFLAKSIRSQARDIVRELRDVFQEFGELVQLVWMKLLLVKWWILLLFAIAVLLLILRPIVNQSIPALSNVADILGIIGFAILLRGMFSNLHRRR